MSLEKAKNHLEKFGLADRIHEFDVSSATVELAAKALGCAEAEIAKSMAFIVEDKPIIIVCAGDTKIDNSKFKAMFHTKAVMIKFGELEPLIGHTAGGVCPFGVNDGVTVYLDESLKRFDTVYPAAGTANSAVQLSPAELEKASQMTAWVDVTKMM
ncbi:MAG: YbaK/EbsC family protein [Acutalibacteraceae bacterium]